MKENQVEFNINISLLLQVNRRSDLVREKKQPCAAMDLHSTENTGISQLNSSVVNVFMYQTHTQWCFIALNSITSFFKVRMKLRKTKGDILLNFLHEPLTAG